MKVEFFTPIVWILNGLFLVSMINIFRLVKTLIKKMTHQLDELEQKALVDSLAISMLVGVVLHILQVIIGVFTFSNGIKYTPVIAPWAFIGHLSINFSRDPFFVRIDSLTFDVFVIGLVYLFTQLNYRLITKKQAFKIYGIPAVILAGIIGGVSLLMR